MYKERVIKLVLEQIRTDVRENDLTAIEGLLGFLPTGKLEGYLSEDEWKFPAPKWMDDREADVIRNLLTAAEDRGYRVSVIDSIEGDGECVVSRSDDYAKAWEELFHGDSAILIFWAGDQRLGFVSLIFNNGYPEDVISDCTDRPEILELMPREEECSY